MPALASSTMRTRRPVCRKSWRRKIATDVGRDAAHHNRADAGRSVQFDQARMLRSHGVRLEIPLIPLPPNDVKSFGAQAGQELGARVCLPRNAADKDCRSAPRSCDDRADASPDSASMRRQGNCNNTLTRGTISKPPGTGNSLGQSVVKPHCISTTSNALVAKSIIR